MALYQLFYLLTYIHPMQQTGGSDPKIFPSHGDWGNCLIQCYFGTTNVPAKWHLTLSNGFSRVQECDRWHTDGHTDRTCYGNGCHNRRNCL